MLNTYIDLINWYNNVFKTTSLYTEMEKVIENSPYHRERSVAVHTDMVFSHYIRTSLSAWGKEEMCGGLATIFHDVGKPQARIEKHSEERGDYVAFPGHELTSARLWENYAVMHWDEFKTVLDPIDIYRVGWLIENHLPWSIKRPEKRNNLVQTATHMFSDTTTFSSVLWADQYGRLADNFEKKIAEVGDWMNAFDEDVYQCIIRGKDLPGSPTAPTMYVPIGPSGCGKSTFSKKLQEDNSNLIIYSLDDLRHQFYSTNYAEAYRMSVEDSTFSSRIQQDFIEKIKTNKDVCVDNTNLSKRRRTFTINQARQRGYWIVAVLFPVALETVLARQETRGDKNVPADAVKNQYMSLQYPSIGEFNDIVVNAGNLK
jgi:predicted kinase